MIWKDPEYDFCGGDYQKGILRNERSNFGS